MLPFILLVLVSSAFAATCANTEGEGACVVVNSTHICPDNMACLIDLSICCKIDDIVSSATTAATVATVATTASTSCVDLLNPATGISDCPSRTAYCNNAAYYDLMTQQCPKTCGRCGGGSVVTSSTCVDKVNPSTGVSDCPYRTAYCTNAVYISLMQVQCPKTCGFC